MVEQMVRAVVQRLLAERYPHLDTPPVLLAEISSATKGPEYRQKVVVDDAGQQKEVELVGYEYVYTLHVLSDAGRDQKYPALPKIKSKVEYAVGSKVVIGLLGGQLQACIIGEV